jgi:hypothetical protein
MATVPEPLAYHFSEQVGQQQHRRAGVPQIVEAVRGKAGTRKDRILADLADKALCLICSE